MSLTQILLIVAVVCFVVAALASFGVLAGINAAAFGFVGLAFFAGAHLA